MLKQAYKARLIATIEKLSLSYSVLSIEFPPFVKTMKLKYAKLSAPLVLYRRLSKHCGLLGLTICSMSVNSSSSVL